MVAHPRFWMDTDAFDVNEFVQSLKTIFSSANAPSPGGDFDYFATTTDTNGNPVTPGCSCTNINSTACALIANTASCDDPITASDLQELCDLQNEITYAQNYAAWLEAWLEAQVELCEADDNENDDGTIPVADLPDNGGTLNSTFAPCPECQDLIDNDRGPTTKYDGLFGTNGWKLNDDCEPKNKWNRKIRKAQKAIDKAYEKLSKEQLKIYDKYNDCQDGDTGGILDQIFGSVVTPNKKYAFDRKRTGLFAFNIKNAFMYLFNSGIYVFI
jgi:hypothetical protein